MPGLIIGKVTKKLRIPNMEFSHALLLLKTGKRIKRPEWKGYLELQVPDENSKMNRPYIYAVCQNGEVVPAVINMLDMLAEDWELVK